MVPSPRIVVKLKLMEKRGKLGGREVELELDMEERYLHHKEVKLDATEGVLR